MVISFGHQKTSSEKEKWHTKPKQTIGDEDLKEIFKIQIFKNWPSRPKVPIIKIEGMDINNGYHSQEGKPPKFLTHEKV